jgi:hypothetical protein
MIKYELRFRTTAIILIAVCVSQLAACSKAPAPLPADEPVVSGKTIRFPVGSSTAQRLLTAPVMSAQKNVLSLPARIVWDEDHTIRITYSRAYRPEPGTDRLFCQA